MMFFVCCFCFLFDDVFTFEVKTYMASTPGAQLKGAHKAWKESDERAAFMAGRQGVQL